MGVLLYDTQKLQQKGHLRSTSLGTATLTDGAQASGRASQPASHMLTCVRYLPLEISPAVAKNRLSQLLTCEELKRELLRDMSRVGSFLARPRRRVAVRRLSYSWMAS
jgi:hypothetical protein